MKCPIAHSTEALRQSYLSSFLAGVHSDTPSALSLRRRRSRNGSYGMLAGGIGSLGLDTSGLDHLAPFLRFGSDEFPKLGGCHGHRVNA